MFARHKQLSSLGRVCSAVLVSGMALAVSAAETPSPGAQGGTPATQAGSWQPHSYEFHYMGFTSTYSCDGLADKLQLLLRLAGARADAKVVPLCTRGYGVPDELAQAKVVFSTLQLAKATSPGASATAAKSVDGVWRHVELAPQHPFELQLGDCELVEQFRDTLLPMFVTRKLNNQVSCVPHQESGSNFSLGFDVFAPAAAAKGA
ncbi:MAG: hypothetical protein ACLQFF_03335 [Steroidobacteraceae bacterium]|jgi:hypothetical protein